MKISQKSKLAAIKRLCVKHRKKLKVLGIVLFEIILITSLLNGTPQGFWLEHQKFPGAQSTKVVEGRKKFWQQVEAEVTRIKKLSPIYDSGYILKNDFCKKGAHDSFFAALSQHNRYAYSCSIELKRYFAFDKNRCEMSIGCYNQEPSWGESFGKSIVSPSTSLGMTSFYKVELFSKDRLDGYLTTRKKCGSGISIRLVYCDAQGTPANASNFPVEAKSVAELSVSLVPYYEK